MNFTENDVQLFCIKGQDYFDIVQWATAEYSDIGNVFHDVSIGQDGAIGVYKQNIKKISNGSRNLFVFVDLAIDVVKEQVALTKNTILVVRDCYNTFASRLLRKKEGDVNCDINDYSINLWKQYAIEFIHQDILGENCFYVNANLAIPINNVYEQFLEETEYVSAFDQEMIDLSSVLDRDIAPKIPLGIIYKPRLINRAIAGANLLIEKKAYDKALDVMLAVKNVENTPETRLHLAKAYSKNGNKNEALEILNQEPIENNESLILNKIAEVYSDARQYDKAVEYGEKALLANKQESHELRTNLGHYCINNYQIDDAIKHFSMASEMFDTPGYKTNLGNAYIAAKQYDKALETYSAALTNSLSEYADIHINMGFLKYYLGQEEEGWKECEHRLKTHLADYIRLYKKEKYWDGKTDLTNKRLFVFGEQGLGDNIQFVRYVKWVKEKYNCYIIYMCSEKLHELMSVCPYIDELASKEKLVYNKDYDYHVSIMSFPHITNNLVPDHNYLNFNNQMYLGDKLNVGICWQGSLGYANDMHRSCPSSLFKILEHSKIKLFSLQKEEEVDFAEKMYLNNFLDTALAINSLDLVVSVDTSIMHLASTLNKPTFGMLSIYHDWRWQQNTTNKWYPSLRLCRQTNGGDWKPVLEGIRNDIVNQFLPNHPK